MASLLPIVILTLFGYSQTEYDLGGAANRTAEFAEFIGTTSFGFIDEDEAYLDYLIRFQNTGNFPATDVVLVDSLHQALDPTSILVTGHSHDYVLEVDTNDVAYFIFEDIMLPDSTSNEPESHGFVRFRIAFDQELIPGDSISNTAGIYFDLNSPIITNTVYNTVFSCGLFGIVPSILDTGMNTLTADGDYLYYQWSLDGFDIEGAISASLDLLPIETAGEIILTTTDSLGCTFSSEPYFYVPSQLDELNSWGWTLWPNPSTGIFTLSGIPEAQTLTYELFDPLGRIAEVGRLSGDRPSLDVRHLPSGVYLLGLIDASGRRLRTRLVKQ